MAIPGHSLLFGPVNQSCWSSASMSDNCFGLQLPNLLFSNSLTGAGSFSPLHGNEPCAAKIGTGTRLSNPRAPTKASFREEIILAYCGYCCELEPLDAEAFAVPPMASPLTTSSTRRL